jgi:hypothetical protein
VDYEERVAGDPGVGGASAFYVSSQIAFWKPDSETLDGLRYRAGCEGFSGRKLSVSTPNDGDACGYRNPLGGVVVGTLSTYGSG